MAKSCSALNFNEMSEGVCKYVLGVQQYLTELETSTQGTVDLGTMFNLQYRTQILCQYMEASSNILTAVHTEMITMARSAKGS
ncbi:hypothetical protein C6H88_00190 [Chlamydia muridarum str. Nigg]|uniref:Uncharacterized protein TC_0037 n=2 Tax=Chlamydia muridarum TaxID=83560 RepID=Y037_CHLMU|nr:DUF5407 family protein [Chlamydia muridarum]Q9PLQ8.1 RecName: Full=Uncharacterized protein TC_0037 [Chlamydia muridarum str. Nigg]UFU85968.1 hypothetical protein FTN29_00200 [Chlamydia trachomatis]AAF38928.1 conserved hypothetical protein [Chlamydia muridarum str. Nigg]AHH22436.1 hypothetical protein TAC_00190 [Chlamydia muridarum str. Nigg3 CMUT3-5]AHH23360.1 hypothetical protein Y015_00190 [Chlamydia muridarum str. Nigg CM972]AID37589.1 hypothetical protein BB17_00195 [Chlamydia muridaru